MSYSRMDRMYSPRRTSSVLVCLLLAGSTALAAQDGYSTSVGVVDGEVLVMKTDFGQGPASLYVYQSAANGTWELADRLSSAEAAATGEGLSPSMALSGDLLLVGSGDAEGRYGAHAFRHGANGGWARAESVALIEGDPPPGEWNVTALFQVMQPPARSVATDGNRALVAIVGGPRRSAGVRVVERENGSESWTVLARLERTDSEANDQFGAALALSGDVALVGAPEHGQAGAVYVFVRSSESGEWSQETVLAAEEVAPESRFGAMVAFDGEVVIVGVPGTAETAGRILAYMRDTAGAWGLAGERSATNALAGDQFGTSFVVAQNQALIGAPGARDGRGAVHAFWREFEDGVWMPAGELPASGAEDGFGLGTAVAMAGDVAVAGAPGASFGRGQAAVYSRVADGGWGEPEWLSLTSDLTTIAGEEVTCTEGKADRFDCSDVDLLAFLPLSDLGLTPGPGGPLGGVSDVWGWTDPTTRREYALVGRRGGAGIVDITNPSSPTYLGLVLAEGGSAQDIKVYADHAFFIGMGNTGMAVFDLSRVRGVTNAPVTWEVDARYDGIAAAHNLVVDEQSGFAYPVGATGGGDTCGGGLHMIDIREPLNPTFAGCYTDTEGLIWAGRTHDGQCVEYIGPDENFQGRQVCFASNETALRIVDVTDKDAPVALAAATYPGMAYIHQGWLTDDQRYYYMNDELDELTGLAPTTRTLVWDVAELDDPILVNEYFGPTNATDHNLYIKGDRMYQANYQAGFRVVDISDRENPEEIGYFDTTPYEGNPPTMGGAFSAFPYFESGTVIVTSSQEGLFILRPARRPVF
jgi:choice-of-anchor B domain-containing protein